MISLPMMVIVAAAWLCSCTVHADRDAGTAADIGGSSQSPRRISTLDDGGYAKMLAKYVDDRGRVNYAAWHRHDADRKTLKNFLLDHTEIDPHGGTRAEQLALYINAYNALTLHGILREYPTTSIRNHTPKLWGYNLWDDLRLSIGGTFYSLEQIEHEVLRKMGEPRIHFAIVCASVGCPRLMAQPYRPATLDAQLELNAKDFFANPIHFRIQGSTVYLSSILDWFGEDFADSDAALLKTIGPWLPAGNPLPQSPRIRYVDYDWSLNSQ